MKEQQIHECGCDTTKYFGDSPVGELCEDWHNGKCTSDKICICKVEIK